MKTERRIVISYGDLEPYGFFYWPPAFERVFVSRYLEIEEGETGESFLHRFGQHSSLVSSIYVLKVR